MPLWCWRPRDLCACSHQLTVSYRFLRCLRYLLRRTIRGTGPWHKLMESTSQRATVNILNAPLPGGPTTLRHMFHKTWNALIAFWRFCSVSIPEKLDPLSQGHTHVDEKPPTWCSTMFGWGWASVVKATVLSGFNRKPRPAKAVTSENSNLSRTWHVSRPTLRKTALNNLGLSTPPLSHATCNRKTSY